MSPRLRSLLLPLLCALLGCDGGVATANSSVDAYGSSDSSDGFAAASDAADAVPVDTAQAIDTAPPSDTAGPDATDTTSPGTAACPAGVVCVDAFPFVHQGNTQTLGPGKLNAYSCKPGTDESGPEQLYRVVIPTAGLLSVAVSDDDATDVDVHILSGPTASQCLDRGDHHARSDVQPGTYWIAVDTFVSSGKPLAGKYQLQIGLYLPTQGPCVMLSGEMARVNDGGNHLAMPATGPIVMEAHLVTDAEPPPYPQTQIEELAAHYQLSQAKTGLVMHRSQVWAPKEGGGTFYGAGIFSPTTFPVIEEGWYVNMYWTKAARPKAGTRMILRLPGSDRAVVVSAGHETGPGNLAHIGGTPEESHFYLKTGHLSVMQLGIAQDQTLPFGPRRCQ